jgi:hypothetical protein
MKRAAATATVGFGGLASLSGSATAEPITQQYADPLQTEAAFEGHGGDLLSSLSAAGLLASADPITELHIRRTAGLADVSANREGTACLAWSNGADEIVSVRSVDDGVLTVTVEPETGRAYAVHNPDSADTKRLYDPDVGISSVEPEYVKGCDCSPYNCDSYVFTEVCTYCVGSDCYTESSCGC